MPASTEPAFTKAIDEALTKADAFDIKEKEEFKKDAKKVRLKIFHQHKIMNDLKAMRACTEKDYKYGKLVETFFEFEKTMYEDFINNVEDLDNRDPNDRIKFHFWHVILKEADLESEKSKTYFSDNYFSFYLPSETDRGEIFKKTFEDHKVFLTLIASKKYEDFLLDSTKIGLEKTIDSIR